MEKSADTSSVNRPVWHLLDKRVSTRNRKVVDSVSTAGTPRRPWTPSHIASDRRRDQDACSALQLDATEARVVGDHRRRLLWQRPRLEPRAPTV